MKIITSVLIILMSCIQITSANDVSKLTYDDIATQNAGYIVYLDFWASWCTPCRKSFPWMNDMQLKYGDKNFRVISVNIDKDQKLAEEFLEKIPANFSVLYDPNGDIASEMQLRGMPSSFLISTTGVVVSAHVGFNDKKKMLYEQEIQHLIQGNKDE
jgi:thiol-disulfide isomerase/thioredoxin